MDVLRERSAAGAGDVHGEVAGHIAFVVNCPLSIVNYRQLLPSAPSLRQSILRHIGHVARVVRGVVEQGEPWAGDVLEVEDVERAGTLIEPVAVFARIDADQRADEEADRGLVRYH